MAIFNQSFLDNHELILTETSVTERLQRTKIANLHPKLTSTTLLVDDNEREILTNHYRESINIAQEFNVPILLGTPTLRANKELIEEAQINININALAGRFLKYLRAEYDSWSENIFIGGIIGCKNDPSQKATALTSREAIDFHSWQIEQLEREELDFFLAYAQPTITEATGIATVMAVTTTPYVISFLIGPDRKLPDGTTLQEAIEDIDSLGLRKPVGYIINCDCPSAFREKEQPESIMERLIGIIANGTAPNSLTNNSHTESITDYLHKWGNHMTSINRHYDLPITGGNIDSQHLHYLTSLITNKD